MRIRKPTQLKALKHLLQDTHYLLCVDLEATCDSAPEGLPISEVESYPLAVPRTEMEVIEVGAVMIDLQDGCRVVGEFSRFVKPVLHPTLTDFCVRLTTIQQADVDAAGSYAEVAQEIDQFLRPFMDEGWLWCSWGEYDRKQLLADAGRAGCASILDPERHTNLKKWFAKVFACRALGLKPATAALGIEWLGTYHRGIDDARNVAAIAWAILHASGPTHRHVDDAAEIAFSRFAEDRHLKALAYKESGNREGVEGIKLEVESARSELEQLREAVTDSFVEYTRRYKHKVWQERM